MAFLLTTRICSQSLLPFVSMAKLLLEAIPRPVNQFLPCIPVQLIAQFPELIHLAPAVSAPFTASHVDQKVSIGPVVVKPLIKEVLPHITLLATSREWEAVDLPLLDESHVGPDVRLRSVDVLEGILLLVFPFHVFLFVEYWIPPDV